MTKSSDAHENLQRWAASDYRLAGSGVESDCKKRAAFLFQLILFNYFLAIFRRVVVSPPVRSMWLTAGLYRIKIVIMPAAVPAIVQTLVFTVVVPRTVARYVPFRFRPGSPP